MNFGVKRLRIVLDEKKIDLSNLEIYLLLPHLGVEGVTGDRGHPVPPALHPDQPGLQLPPPPLHLLLANVQLLQLALPCKNLAKGYFNPREAIIFIYKPTTYT